VDNLTLFAAGDSKTTYLDIAKIVAVEVEVLPESSAKRAFVYLAGCPSPLILEEEGTQALIEKLVSDGVIVPTHPPSS
jgi:hypothetical protein